MPISVISIKMDEKKLNKQLIIYEFSCDVKNSYKNSQENVKIVTSSFYPFIRLSLASMRLKQETKNMASDVHEKKSWT